MKKILLAAAIVALSLTACSKKEASDTAQAEEIAATQEASADETITAQTENNISDCTDDEQFRPGMKVDQLTILDFTATWCGPCQKLKPVFHEATAQYPGVTFMTVDYDRNPKTVEAFGITGIPTVVILKPDGTMESYTGTDKLLPAEKLTAIITNAVQSLK